MDSHLYYQIENYFFSAISKKSKKPHPDALLYITGVESENLNIFCLKQNIENFFEILLSIRNYLVAENLPWSLIIPDYCSLDPFMLKKEGFYGVDHGITMVLDLEKLETFLPQPHLKIELIEKDLSVWISPLIEAFESTLTVCNQYQLAHEMAIKNEQALQHYCLFEERKAITSLTLSVNNKLARIDDLGTLRNYQKKGHGRYLIHYALQAAKKAGARYCFLEASTVGLSLYQKLGFTSLFARNYYVLQNIQY